ncbi:helix-turn-helix domain-containing protein [Enterococcus sp. CR-Ec1]|uniref:helix-turn-helix domain-containing protein n=1 Tax=Enterococcus sp. CR-Ec1 TaxID=2057791 RepID=UPI000C78B94A|nr:helix-turn-helix domain-containing protein [Enterococcus sp. CR-Ec1]AUJ87419.1 hypothetical protein CXM95_18450 [Enterococcus sp. CR-Ec1]
MIEIHKQEILEIKVLQFLHKNQNKWLKLKRMADYFDVSPPKMSKILKGLSILGSENQHIAIEIIASKGIYVTFSRNKDFLELCEYIYKNSLPYKLIYALLNESIRDLGEFADSNYISVASVRRVISRINNVLKGKNITIVKNKIIGSEINIRAFFFCYFWEIHKGYEWPFDSQIKKDTIIRIHEKAYVKSGVLLNLSSYEQVYYLLAISFIRSKQKMYVESDAEFENLSANNPLFNIMREVWSETFWNHPQYETEFQYIFFVGCSFSLDYKRTDKEIIKNLVDMYSKKKTFFSSVAYSTIKKIKLGESLSVPFEIDNMLFLEAIIGYHKAYLLGDMVSIVGLEYSYFKNCLAKSYPDYYLKSIDLLNNTIQEFEKREVNEAFIHELQASWWLKLKEQNKKQLNLMISLSNGPIVEKYVLKK